MEYNKYTVKPFIQKALSCFALTYKAGFPRGRPVQRITFPCNIYSTSHLNPTHMLTACVDHAAYAHFCICLRIFDCSIRVAWHWKELVEPVPHQYPPWLCRCMVINKSIHYKFLPVLLLFCCYATISWLALSVQGAYYV